MVSRPPAYDIAYPCSRPHAHTPALAPSPRWCGCASTTFALGTSAAGAYGPIYSSGRLDLYSSSHNAPSSGVRLLWLQERGPGSSLLYL
ncbi:hypothetical protein FRC12_015870 [Ceratobasidium sp. 428]|nr:hypothetical protein FRC12_015870 [Ceratobasidium sp. 428]